MMAFAHSGRNEKLLRIKTTLQSEQNNMEFESKFQFKVLTPKIQLIIFCFQMKDPNSNFL